MNAPFPPLRSKGLFVDILIPVYNEEGGLSRSIRELDGKLKGLLPYAYRITVVDNGSTDGTMAQARKLERKFEHLRVVHLDQKGRGRALRTVWLESEANLLAYMDVDLSTDVSALPTLLAPLVSGEAAVSVGSRLLPGSTVKRSAKREFISRAYNWLLRRSLRFPVCDAQCGFKAIRSDVARELLPTIEDNGWFFDTELLAKADRQGLPIREVPVVWVEDPDSRVNIASTALADLQGVDRLRRENGEPPLWEWPLLGLLVAATLLLYLVGLSKNGYGNDFYAAAVQAGTKSWKAFFFGSFDSANFITVDKPPLSLWAMELFGRVFGFSRLSMLVPNALAGVASVFVLQRTVRRWYGAGAGLLAGLVLALTPVAVVMFRYNNPDAILTLLLVVSGYCFVRALESGRTKWLVWVGIVLGLAFISKMLQALIVLPVYAAVYLWLAQPPFWTRFKQTLWAGLALVIAGGWWPLIVGLVPAADRPYVGGSTNDSEWNLIFGYNGFGRISGNEGSGRGMADAGHALSAGGGFGGAAFGGQTGILRMFEQQFGGQISWLMPVALLLLIIGVWSRRGKPRTDLARAGYILWGGWLLIHAAVFSFAQGIIHEYYSVVMAPAVGALVGAGLPLLWTWGQTRSRGWLWPVTMIGSGVWAWVLLERTASFVPWLRWAIIVAALVAAIGWLAAVHRSWSAIRSGMLSLGALSLLAGPLAYDLQTVQAAHSGGQPTAGPQTAMGFGAAGRGTEGRGERLTDAPQGFTGMAGRGGFERRASFGEDANFSPRSGGLQSAFRGAGRGFGGEQAADPQLVSYLKSHMGTATWAAAVSTTSSAASLELALDQPVMGMGGFMGSDPVPTLAQFQAYVKEGKLKYVVVTAGFGAVMGDTESESAFSRFGGAGFGGRNSDQTAIQQWVTAHGTKVNYGGTGSTLYEVTPDSL